MKKLIITCLTATFLLTSCNIKKEEKGALPEVDVDVSADSGNLPEYDINWADVDVSTTTRTVEIPNLVVVMEEEEVEVPVIDVNMPGEENIERTLLVETEVSDVAHDLAIREVRASDDKLYVIASLERLNRDLQDQTVRIQDQVDINAPDLNVAYIIIGKKPDRLYNNNNTYVNSMNDLDDDIVEASIIYTE